MLSADHGTCSRHGSKTSFVLRIECWEHRVESFSALPGRAKLSNQLHTSSISPRPADVHVVAPECILADVFLSTFEGRVHGSFCL